MNKAVSDTKVVQRVRVVLQGAVQGVGFRPFVYRLAVSLNLSGFVGNSSEGVTIEAEGLGVDLEEFLMRIRSECPPHAYIEDFQILPLPIQNGHQFIIRDSQNASRPVAIILPDIATCSECLHEILDPSNRRYRYPFTNCTHCGPRYSIIEHLPYDRRNTSMKNFVMCPECQREYNDPSHRRFHAQPNACPVCGPQLQILNKQGKVLGKGQEALLFAVSALNEGRILALKGLGGFQFMVDACNEKAVVLLRERKHREEKPLAMMFPSIDMVMNYGHVSFVEKQTLTSVQAPIVLISKRNTPLEGSSLATSIAYNNPFLGVMLPYTPLHHLLIKEFAGPVVATSANYSDEPMCIDNEEALDKLANIADVFLVHDRPIVRPVDDSVGMIINGRFSITRRARGFAPLPIFVKESEATVLALGAQMKNTVALKVKNKVYLSQHIGDLKSPEALTTFTQSIKSLRHLYSQPLNYIAVDLHPDYMSTRHGHGLKEPSISIQHHHAHVVSCMAEHRLKGPVLGLAWDGTGLGEDNTIWGGEFLLSSCSNFDRVGHLLAFRIPGGESSIRQPKRTALGLLAALSDHDLTSFKDLIPVSLFSDHEIVNIQKMLSKGIQSPYTTSMGRLFDGVSALLGLCQESSFEGQAAMRLEHNIQNERTTEMYSWVITHEVDPLGKFPFILDWRPMVIDIIAAIRAFEPTSQIAAKFHNTLVEMAIDVVRRVGEHQVVLSGGCFQNRYLTQRLIDRLKEEGFDPYWHSQVPTNDGGIALGQAVIAAARFEDNTRIKSCV
ncbi:MAG: carbamoyltransferase HypF [Candidatus Omnitrophica bacterium]|nr:carbamoyltransferase HypF [Candidatus Omnitrophota bacterium]